ncbi:MAG: MBL fold metallo-hydrolase [bacterium]|nr:MBL fold metallo-hydrolase [Candidatus Sumerlaeota bacterium]
MRVVVLGSGTSAGVPTLGCDCDVCRSINPRNKRLRSSVYIEEAGLRMLVDCGPDFRTQAINHSIRDVDCVLLTHTHADHINGIDDLRAYNMMRNHPIDVYALPEALDELRRRFDYCFRPPPLGSMVPDLILHKLRDNDDIRGVGVQTIPIIHGEMEIIGFRFEKFAYLTDVSRIPELSYAMLEGLEVLMLNALRRRPHPLHMNLEQAVTSARRIGARRTWFTHICHDLDHDQINAQLPAEMQLAHDGLVFEI